MWLSHFLLTTAVMIPSFREDDPRNEITLPRPSVLRSELYWTPMSLSSQFYRFSEILTSNG